MPAFGKPIVNNRRFSNIKMHSPVSNKSDQINKIAGNKNDRRFVDRARHTQLDADDFMKLLTHQLANQDPTNPMDQKKFASELAQFGQLEQLRGVNMRMKEMVEGNPMKSKYYGASFLGKQVMTSGSSVNYKGKELEIPFVLPKNASKAILRIYDSKNQLAKQIDFEKLNKGSQYYTWDGTQTDGSKVKEGNYRVEVLAWDETLAKFSGETKVSGLVTGVSFKDGETLLEVDGKKRIFLHDVENFKILDDNKSSLKIDNKLAQKNNVIKAYSDNQEVEQ